MTAFAVVRITHRQDWASLWTAKGYRIHGALDHTDAETWAIWQALEVILEKVHTDCQTPKPWDRRESTLQDPCSIAVIYPDCRIALQRIGKNFLVGGSGVVEYHGEINGAQTAWGRDSVSLGSRTQRHTW